MGRRARFDRTSSVDVRIHFSYFLSALARSLRAENLPGWASYFHPRGRQEYQLAITARIPSASIGSAISRASHIHCIYSLPQVPSSQGIAFGKSPAFCRSLGRCQEYRRARARGRTPQLESIGRAHHLKIPSRPKGSGHGLSLSDIRSKMLRPKLPQRADLWRKKLGWWLESVLIPAIHWGTDESYRVSHHSLTLFWISSNRGALR